MRWFADLPIERKLRVAIVIPAAIAFLIAMGVHTASEVVQFHKDVRERSAALARFIGANTVTAMKHADEKQAYDVLTERTVQRPVFSEPKTWEKSVTVNANQPTTVNFAIGNK